MVETLLQGLLSGLPLLCNAVTLYALESIANVPILLTEQTEWYMNLNMAMSEYILNMSRL